MTGTYLLDYGAGNVRSLVNAVKKLGHDITFVKDPSDILKADVKNLLPVQTSLTHSCEGQTGQSEIFFPPPIEQGVDFSLTVIPSPLNGLRNSSSQE